MYGKWPFLAPMVLILTCACAPTEKARPEEYKPDGAEIYGQFMDNLESMDSLCFDSTLLWKSGDQILTDGRVIRYYLKKPDTYRCEVIQPDGTPIGLLVCDGQYCWSTWPQGTTIFNSHKKSPKREVEVYLKEGAYQGKSIFHQLSLIGALPVFNANAFFGGKESLDPYLDGIEYLREEECEGEPCHLLKVSYMEGQRVRHVWISKNDLFPRKWVGELRLANPQSTREVWTRVEVDSAMDEELFRWVPPVGYKEGRRPTLEERLLQVGDVARTFKLRNSRGEMIDTADYTGKIIWLMFWRIG